MKRASRRAVLGMAVLAAGTTAGWRWWPRAAAPARTAATAPDPVEVIRADLVRREQVPGTMGYAGDWPIAHPGVAGVLTWAPQPGASVQRGQRLYEVDGRPVYLLYGGRPVWRDLAPGGPPGEDVRQLEANLAALGLSPGAADDRFTAATAAAVRRWQGRLGQPRTGRLPLGTVVFAPEAARVVAVPGPPGTRVGAGPVVRLSSTRPVVTVALPTSRQANVAAGGSVLVTLPDGRPVPGTVTEVGRVATIPEAGAAQQPTIAVLVTLDAAAGTGNLDQAPVQVAITTAARPGVLAVPVTALRAADAGGYEVVVVEGGSRRALPVRPGLFDERAGLIEVTGDGLAPGVRVEVPG